MILSFSDKLEYITRVSRWKTQNELDMQLASSDSVPWRRFVYT